VRVRRDLHVRADGFNFSSAHEDDLIEAVLGAEERKEEKKSESADIHRSERFVGRFQRTLTLPSQMDVDKVKANYQDGILTVTLPKSEAAKTKQIQIKTR